MITYFDVITQTTQEINDSTIIYIVAINDNQFLVRAISEGLELLATDPMTHQDHYWLIDTREFLATVRQTRFIFPDNELRTAPLSEYDVARYFGFNPNHTPADFFNDNISRELIINWSNQMFPAFDAGEVSDNESEATTDSQTASVVSNQSFSFINYFSFWRRPHSELVRNTETEDDIEDRDLNVVV